MKTTTRTIRRVDPRWLSREIGRRLRAEREANDMTLEGVGVLLGVTRSAVHNWERGNHGMLLHVIYDLALLYKVSVRKLLP